MAAQILGLGGIDSTNSALNIGPGPGICAVVGCASVPPAPPIFNLRFLGLCSSTNSGTWWIDTTNSALNIGPGPRICAVVGGAGGMGVFCGTFGSAQRVLPPISVFPPFLKYPVLIQLTILLTFVLLKEAVCPAAPVFAGRMNRAIHYKGPCL